MQPDPDIFTRIQNNTPIFDTHGANNVSNNYYDHQTRNLTVTRTKAFFGCLGKAKVYIEDPNSKDIFINNTFCRKIGDLKNGETKTFSIGTREAKVFVIPSKSVKYFCNDYYPLSEGHTDISLSGHYKYTLTMSTPFRFNNNDSEEVIANRKRSARQAIRFIIVYLAVCFAIGVAIAWTILKQ